MEERYHATTQNRFYPDMSNANNNITGEAKLISPSTNIFYKLTTYQIPCQHCNTCHCKHIRVQLLMCLIKHTFFLSLTVGAKGNCYI